MRSATTRLTTSTGAYAFVAFLLGVVVTYIGFQVVL
jgi:hypothetical protein